jgi:hypothetical protein
MQLMGQYLFTQDGQAGAVVQGRGYSFFLSLDSCKAQAIRNADRSLLGTSCGTFFRYERFDPNDDVSEDAHSRMILGYQKLLQKGVGASLNYRRLSFEEDSRDTESEIYLNVLIEF